MPPKKPTKPQPVQIVENYVTLVSSDKREFIVKEAAVACSSVLRKEVQLEKERLGIDQADTTSTNTAPTQQKPLSEMPRITLPQIDSQLLEYLVDYMNQRLLNEFLTEFPVLNTLDTSQKDDRQLVLELLLAANYLAL